MKKLTLIIWAIIFGLIALVIFQNQAFFLAKQSLRVNLGIIDAYYSPELPNAVILIIFFLAGLVIAYVFNFPVRFRARQTIKKLNAKLATRDEEMSELKREIQNLKGEAISPEGRPIERLDEGSVERFHDGSDEKGVNISGGKQETQPFNQSDVKSSNKYLSS
jgi:uncharacterized integral membrane protein